MRAQCARRLTAQAHRLPLLDQHANGRGPARQPPALQRQRCRELAATKTALRGLEERHIQRLINWGYILADDRLRSKPEFGQVPAPSDLPYSGAPVWPDEALVAKAKRATPEGIARNAEGRHSIAADR